ncbi:MAG: thiamine-binding protein [Ilumatobacteraceae bacterium]
MSDPMRVEFTIEPWVEGGHPDYVHAAIATAEASGLPVDIGPFGIGVEGPTDDLFQLLPHLLRAALDAGADRISLQVTRLADTDRPGSSTDC